MSLKEYWHFKIFLIWLGSNTWFWIYVVVKDISDYENFFPCQPFCRDFFLCSSSSLFFFAGFFQYQKQHLFIFVSTMKEGFRLLLLHKKKKKTKEWLKGFRFFCFAFLSVDGDVVKDKWRIYTNTKSFPPPSAEKATACANRM